jgi:uncharacterized membrane protein (UPF0127 family)
MKLKELIINGHPTGAHVAAATAFFSRVRGLMFRKTFPWSGLLIIPCSGIHTFFMRFSIDVVFINKDNKVTKIADHLAPWNIALPGGFSSAVLELPAGKVQELKLHKGDIVTFR